MDQLGHTVLVAIDCAPNYRLKTNLFKMLCLKIVNFLLTTCFIGCFICCISANVLFKFGSLEIGLPV